jgi:hypothetical protein
MLFIYKLTFLRLLIISSTGGVSQDNNIILCPENVNFVDADQKKTLPAPIQTSKLSNDNILTCKPNVLTDEKYWFVPNA